MFGGSVIAAGIIDAGISLAASIGISYAAQALAGKPKAPEAAHFSTQGQIQSDGAIPRSFLLGNTFTAGSLVYHNTWGTSDDGKSPNAYYTKVIRLSDLPVQSLNAVWIGGEKCTLTTTAPSSGSNNNDLMGEALRACVAAGIIPLFNPAGLEFIANYMNSHGVSDGTAGYLDEKGAPVLEYRKDGKDHVWIKFYDGTQTTSDSFLTGKVSSNDRPYQDTRVGTGVAYAIATALVEDTLFSGFPEYKFEVSGIRLYDPTKDDTNGGTGSHRFSDPSTWGGDGDLNPAVQAYNILRGVRYNGAWMYGLQKTVQANLPTLNWNAQINKCRALVQGVGGLEPTYLSAGQISVDQQPADALDALMTACQGKISEVGGFYKVHLGTPDTQTFAFTDEDILSSEEQTYTPFLTLADSINGITATYPDPTQAWNTVSAPALTNDEYEAEDGSRRLLANPAFDFVPYAAQVQRLMQSALYAARRERKHQIVMPPPFWAIEPGDVCAWTSARNGYDGKLFEVVSISDKANVDILVTLQEVDPTDYDWNHDADFRTPTSGPTTFPRPEPQGVVDWNVEGAVIYGQDGLSVRPAIHLTWDGDIPGITGIRWRVRLASDQSLVTADYFNQPDIDDINITQSLMVLTNYEVSIQYIPTAPRDMTWSEWRPVSTPDAKLGAADIANYIVNKITTGFSELLGVIKDASDTLDGLAADAEAQAWLDRETDKSEMVVATGAISASITAVKTIAISAQEAIAAYQFVVEAQFNTTNANVTQEILARAQVDSALATEIDTVTTTVNGHTASLQLVASSVNGSSVYLGILGTIDGVTGGLVLTGAKVNGVTTYDFLFDGNQVVRGTITASALNVISLTAISVHFGDAIVDGNLTGANGHLQVSFSNDRITVSQ